MRLDSESEIDGLAERWAREEHDLFVAESTLLETLMRREYLVLTQLGLGWPSLAITIASTMAQADYRENDRFVLELRQYGAHYGYPAAFQCFARAMASQIKETV